MDEMLDFIKRRKGVLLSELLLLVIWFSYLIKLNQLIATLKAYYTEADGAIARAFKLVFSDQAGEMAISILIGMVLILFLIVIPVYVFKFSNNSHNYYYDENLYMGGVLAIINLISGLFVFTTLLAPILISFVIVGIIVLVIIYMMTH